MEELQTDDAPAAIGPYSQGVKDSDRIYVSGQGPIDPSTGEIIEGDIQDETAQTIENIAAILESADRSLSNVLKTTVFLRDMDHYDAVNEVYGEYFEEPYPARSAVEVDDLPIDIGIEIEVIARA